MGAPPDGVCHFPVDKGDGRKVFCGDKCIIIDPQTGDKMMFCAKHQKELEMHLAKRKMGEQGYRSKGHLKIGKVHMYGK